MCGRKTGRDLNKKATTIKDGKYKYVESSNQVMEIRDNKMYLATGGCYILYIDQ